MTRNPEPAAVGREPLRVLRCRARAGVRHAARYPSDVEREESAFRTFYATSMGGGDQRRKHMPRELFNGMRGIASA